MCIYMYVYMYINYTLKATVVYSDSFETSTVNLRKSLSNMFGCI